MTQCHMSCHSAAATSETFDWKTNTLKQCTNNRKLRMLYWVQRKANSEWLNPIW
jgi:hypothetical protein